MRAEWVDACSNLAAFSRHSKCEPQVVQEFHHLLTRLFSLLHAMALAELEDSCGGKIEDTKAFCYELIDVEGLDAVSLLSLKAAECKSELVFQWIQLVIVENMSTGVLNIPPPMLSRVFQELAGGRVAFVDALQIACIPFPFPYAQTCDCLLAIHWVVSPFVVSLWVHHWLWAAIFTFIQVFVLWALNFIALEIQNPFGQDRNDLDGHQMQIEMNRQLLLLLSPEGLRTPSLTPCAKLSHQELRHGHQASTTLRDIWSGSLEATGAAPECLLHVNVEVQRVQGKRLGHGVLSHRDGDLEHSLSPHFSPSPIAPRLFQSHVHFASEQTSSRTVTRCAGAVEEVSASTAEEARAGAPAGVPPPPVSSRRKTGGCAVLEPPPRRAGIGADPERVAFVAAAPLSAGGAGTLPVEAALCTEAGGSGVGDADWRLLARLAVARATL